MPAPRAKARRSRSYPWASLDKSELLDVRFCDLDLKIEGTWLEQAIEKVQEEIADRGLELEPHFWLSDEWFVPDGVNGVAIPFYLAHPRLVRLERSEMMEVEGGEWHECLRILRHELGHVVDNAFRLSRRRRYQQLFGKASDPYPEFYSPDPSSRRHVIHLDGWYAQAHPAEDFAETFAVWLKPKSGWRRRYADWPAKKKLVYVDELMQELVGQPPKVRSRARLRPLHRMKKTLRKHYAEKKAHYSVDAPTIYDSDLKRLFSDDPAHRNREPAADFLRRNRVEIRRMVAKWTGQYELTLDLVLKEMIQRSRELKLRAVGPKPQLRVDFAILLTVKTMHQLYYERHWLAV